MQRLRPYFETLLWCLICAFWIFSIVQERVIFQEHRAAMLRLSEGTKETDYPDKELYKTIESLKNGTSGNWWQSWNLWVDVFFLASSAGFAVQSFCKARKKLSQSSVQTV